MRVDLVVQAATLAKKTEQLQKLGRSVRLSPSPPFTFPSFSQPRQILLIIQQVSAVFLSLVVPLDPALPQVCRGRFVGIDLILGGIDQEEEIEC